MRTTPGNPAATTLIETGILPSGVTFTDNGDGTATLAGTPAAGTSGTATFIITASNSLGLSITQAFTLMIDMAPTLGSLTPPPTTGTTAPTPFVSLGFVATMSDTLAPDGQEVVELISSTGVLTQYDAAGAHQLATGVRSASVAFGGVGEVMVVVYQDGRLLQYDAAGGHLLASGVAAAGVALTPATAEVLDVIFADGSLWQYDATGSHRLASV